MKKIISGFTPDSGKHCITNALKQIFRYYGHPLTEEMLFGLGCGISFCYLNQASSPMLNGRSKPFVFEKILASRLNIIIRCRKPKDSANAFAAARQSIDRDQPVFIYVDMPYLKYLNLEEDYHFGGHAVVLFGYDDDQQLFYISDRDSKDHPIPTPKGCVAQDYHLVSYEDMENARSSCYRPFPAHHKYLDFDFSNIRSVSEELILDAVRENSLSMLNAPAHLLGLNGIEKFSKEVLKWKNFDPEKRKRTGTTNYFMINADGGTGGGLFRKMYGSFLIEASNLTGLQSLAKTGKCFLSVGDLWDGIADHLWTLSETGNIDLLPVISETAKTIHTQETALFQELLDNTHPI